MVLLLLRARQRKKKEDFSSWALVINGALFLLLAYALDCCARSTTPVSATAAAAAAASAAFSSSSSSSSSRNALAAQQLKKNGARSLPRHSHASGSNRKGTFRSNSEGPLFAFVGVQSRPVTERRDLLRTTWFPGTREAMRDLRRKHHVAAAFVIGRGAPGTSEEALVEAESQRHGDIMRVDIVEDYENLLLKSVAFFRTAAAQYPEAKFYVKADDDIYVRLDRIGVAAIQWVDEGSEYVGCLNIDKTAHNEPGKLNHEPMGSLYYQRYMPGYFAGPIYALSRSAIGVFADIDGAGGRHGGGGGGDALDRSSRSKRASGLPAGVLPGIGGPNGLGRLRPLSCEDCTMGLWMLAHNVAHGEDPRLCATDCSIANAVVAVYHGDRCNGLCDPSRDLALLHETAACREEGPLVPFWSAASGQRKLSKLDVELLRCRKEEDGLISTAACRF